MPTRELTYLATIERARWGAFQFRASSHTKYHRLSSVGVLTVTHASESTTACTGDQSKRLVHYTAVVFTLIASFGEPDECADHGERCASSSRGRMAA